MDVVLFGNTEFASLTWHALTHDSPHRVVGFTVHHAFNNRGDHHGLPVVDFEAVETEFDPATTLMIVSVGWHESNRLRERLSIEAAAKGFRFGTYVSSRAILADGVEIAANCIVFDGVIVQPFARVGTGTILRSGCHLSHHVQMGDYCFVAAEAAIGGSTRVEKGSFIGMNATVHDGLRLGSHTTVGAGAQVRRDTQPGESRLGPDRRAPGRS